VLGDLPMNELSGICSRQLGQSALKHFSNPQEAATDEARRPRPIAFPSFTRQLHFVQFLEAVASRLFSNLKSRNFAFASLQRFPVTWICHLASSFVSLNRNRKIQKKNRLASCYLSEGETSLELGSIHVASRRQPPAPHRWAHTINLKAL